jgi:hypothetical protein
VRSSDRVRLLTRKGIDLATRFPLVAAAALAFNPVIPPIPALPSLLAQCRPHEPAGISSKASLKEAATALARRAWYP